MGGLQQQTAHLFICISVFLCNKVYEYKVCCHTYCGEEQ